MTFLYGFSMLMLYLGGGILLVGGIAIGATLAIEYMFNRAAGLEWREALREALHSPWTGGRSQ